MAIERIAIEIKSNANEIESQLSDIDNRIKKLKSSKAELQIRADQLESARKSISNIDIAIRKLQAQKAELKISSEPADVAREKIKNVQRSIDVLRATKANLQVETQQLKGADRDLNNLNKEMNQLSNKKARLQVEQQDVVETQQGLTRLGSRLREIGSTKTKIDISTNLDKIGNQLDNFGGKLLGVFNPLGSKINQLIGIGAALKLISKAGDLVTSSLDGAIDRFDTMNNFPKVMSNLKISEQDAAEAVEILKSNLNGLPTTLDEATNSVQRFASKNKDVKKSTKMFLALNNAILAGGQSTQIQSSALEQLSQAYSKGSIDMVEWRSALTAMPAQIDQVAQAYGLSSDQLGEALRSGEISMDSFIDKIIELNETGVNGFKSFEEQARNATGGIKTSLKTMGSAVTRGIERIIGASDNVLGNTSFGGITGVFGSIGKAFETGFGKIADLIEKNEDKIVVFVDRVKTAFTNFDWKSFGAGLKEGFDSLKNTVKSFWNVLKPILNGVKGLITSFGGGSFEKGLGKLPALIVKVGVAAKALGKVLKLVSKYSNFSLSSIFGGGKSTGTSGGGSGGGFQFNFDAGKALNQFKNLALVAGISANIMLAAEAIKQVNEKVPSDVGDFALKIVNLGIALVAMGAFTALVGKLAENNTDAAIAGLLTVAAISGNIILAAEAMRQVDIKVPGNISGFAKKLANMAIAIGGMGVLIAAAGLLAQSNPVTAIAGLAVVAAISLELMLAAEAMRQVDAKVPSNIKDFAKKMANMGIAIGGMTLVVTAVGAFVATGFGAIAIIAGLATIAAIAGELILVAEAVAKIDKKVPRNISGIKKKISNMATVIGAFAKLSTGSLRDIKSSDIKKVKKSVKALSDAVGVMIGLTEELKDFASVSIGTGNSKNGSDKIIASIEENLDSIKKIINKISETELPELQKAKFLNNIKESINGIKGIANAIAELYDTFKELGEDLTKRIKIGGDGDIQIDLFEIEYNFNRSMDALSSVIETISSYELPPLQKAKTLGKITDSIESIKEIALAISDLNDTFDGLSDMLTATTTLTQGSQNKNALLISQAAKSGNEIPEGSTILTIVKNFQDYMKALDSVINSINTYKLEKLQKKGTLQDIKDSVISIGDIANAIAQLNETFDRLSEVLTGTTAGSQRRNPNASLISQNIMGTNGIPQDTKVLKIVETVTESMNALKQVIDAINRADLGELDNIDHIADIEEYTTSLSKIIGTLREIEANRFDHAVISGIVDDIKKIVSSLSEIQTEDATARVQELIDLFLLLGEQLSALNINFESIGTGYAQQIVLGFQNEEVEEKIGGFIDDLIKKLSDKTQKFTDIGKKYGSKLKEAFRIAVENLHTMVDAPILALTSVEYLNRFSNAGTLMGQRLASAFRSEISSMSSYVAEQVSSIQSSLGSITVPDISVNVGNRGTVSGFSRGGEVQHLSSGGLAGLFKPRGTDTVPAMLTPGEFVQNRKAVRAFGIDFMNKVNSLDIHGAFLAMTRRFNTGSMLNPSVSNVVNSIHSTQNTNNAKVTQNIHGGNPAYSFKRANRWVKGL